MTFIKNELKPKSHKTEVKLLELAKQLSSVSKTCKAMSYSRDSYYRFKDLYEKRGRASSVRNKS